MPLRACASFDRTSYKSGDIVKLTVSVTNLGTALASGVSLVALMPSGDTNLHALGYASPLFDQGVGIQPGETVSGEVDGYANDPASGYVQFNGVVSEGNDNGLSNGSINISASVTQDSASYGGVVYTDTNGNGRPDPGEGLAAATVTLTGPFQGLAGSTGASTYTAKTDTNGDFQIPGLPAGQYYENVTAPNGWVVHTPTLSSTVVIDSSLNQTNVPLLATRPLSETLKASMSFDQPSYQVGQPVHLTITLVNSGATAITGIQAGCDHVGDPDELHATEPAWGALAGNGVTLPPNSTTTLHVSPLMPTGGLEHGLIYAECVFGPNVSYFTQDDPDVSTTASAVAPANPTTVTVTLAGRPELGAINSGITLVDSATGDVIAWGEENTQTFTNVPAGIYTVVPGPGYVTAPGQSPVTTGPAGSSSQWTVQVNQAIAIHPMTAH